VSKTIDYYLSLNSPWTYMGHARLTDLAAHHQLTVNVHPVDYRGIIFPATGGLPLGKRSLQRQAYRLMELERWRKHLGIALNIQPKFWPVDEGLAAGMVRAAGESSPGALTLVGALLRAVWAENRDIADRDTLSALAVDCELDAASLMAEAEDDAMAERRASDSERAIERGVFGAPTYIYDGAVFWGQDRLELLALAVGGAS